MAIRLAAAAAIAAAGCGGEPDSQGDDRLGSAEQALTCVTVQNVGPHTTNIEDAQIVTDPTDPTRANTNYGATTQMIAGTMGTGYQRIVMKFDLAGGGVPSDAIISSATLSIHMLQSLGKNPVDVYAGTGLWSEASVTWAQIGALPNAGMGALQASVATMGVANNSVLAIPISAAAMQSWLDPATSYGILLDHPTPGRTTFGSSEAGPAGRPTLDVCYSLPSCPSPTSWWRGDGDMTDSAGTNDGFSGAQNGAGAVGYAPGHLSSAFALNGQSYVEVPDAASLEISGGITMSAWVFTNGGGGRILDKITAGGVDGYLLDTYGGFRLVVGPNWITNASPLPTGVWVHVAGTWDGVTGRLYVNGALVHSEAALSPGPIPINAVDLRIGADSLGNTRWDGLIDEAAVYDIVLTPAQIASLATGVCP